MALCEQCGSTEPSCSYHYRVCGSKQVGCQYPNMPHPTIIARDKETHKFHCIRCDHKHKNSDTFRNHAKECGQMSIAAQSVPITELESAESFPSVLVSESSPLAESSRSALIPEYLGSSQSAPRTPLQGNFVPPLGLSTPQTPSTQASAIQPIRYSKQPIPLIAVHTPIAKRPLSPPPTNERPIKRTTQEDVFAGPMRISASKKTTHNTQLRLIHKIIELLSHPEICVACYALGIDGVAHDLSSCRGGVATYADPNWKAFRDLFHFRYGRDCMGCGISKDFTYQDEANLKTQILHHSAMGPGCEYADTIRPLAYVVWNNPELKKRFLSSKYACDLDVNSTRKPFPVWCTFPAQGEDKLTNLLRMSLFINDVRGLPTV